MNGKDLFVYVEQNLVLNNMEEYFLITWHESGDEIHFMMLPMSDFEYVNSMVEKLSNLPSWDDVNKFLNEFTGKLSLNFCIQTYCTEDWPYGKYNIKKIISIPEFGC